MKRIYSFITLMFLAIGSAWAGSYLYILGEEIDLSKSWTRSASSFVSGATGTISFDVDHFVIKFTNVKIPGNNSKKVVHNKVYRTLEIAFEGECELYSMDKVIQYDASTTLNGSASTSVKMHSNWDEETLYSNESNDDGAADLTLKGFRYLELWSLGDYCISHKYGEVIINDSHVVMEGDKGTIHSNSYATSSFSRIQLKDSFYGGNYTWLNTGSSRDIATATSDTKNEKVKKCVILCSSEYSGVRLNGEPILMSDSRWNASTSTVTLNAEVNASSNFTYQGAITAEKSGITIDGGGKNFYGRKYGMQVKSGTTITIRNMALNGYDAGLYAGLGKVTIGDNVSIFGVDYAINNDGNITFSPSSGKNVVLMPAIGYSETYYGTLFRNRAIRASSIQLNECSAYPEGITVSGNTFVSGSTPWQQQVVIKGWEKYDLWVNGTQVNENNKDNLTSLLGSSATGTLKYNPSTNTLTMNNLKAAPSTSDTQSTLINTNYNPLTIAVEGENEITTNTNSYYTIWCSSSLTVTKGSTSTSKLTLKGNPKWGFIRANAPTIKDVTLTIDGQAPDGGILNTLSNVSGNISNATVSVKSASKPLVGKWATSGVYGKLQSGNGPDITIHPSTQQLVYFYDGQTAPSNVVVTQDIEIYRSSGYPTVNGSKPGGFTQQQGVCYDEFSRRLFLRNTKFNGKIGGTVEVLKVYTIGLCEVTNDECPFDVNVLYNLTFTGPGQLTLNATNSNGVAAKITGQNVGNPSLNVYVTIKDTQLYLNGKVGMKYIAVPNYGILNVYNSSVESHTPGGIALQGFNSMFLSDCTLYTPQGGTYNGILYNVDGSVASDMLILPYAPTTITLDAYANNNLILESNYEKEVFATINNLTIKGDGTWRTICLPFDLKLQGSVFKNCEVREADSLRQEGKVGILYFTKRVLEMKANTPYLIRNTSGTDITNPNFVVVKILANSLRYTQWMTDITYYDCFFSRISLMGYFYTLEDSPLLVMQSQYTVNAFEVTFGLMEGLDYYVIYTGPEVNDLIDGIDDIEDSKLKMANDVYDLSGRKYDALPNKSGIYIKNGKKVIVK